MPEIETIDMLEGIATTRSIHRYRFDPIPDEDLGRILYAATRAPSGTNRQPFRFVVLRDGERAGRAKAILGDAYRRGWRHKAESEGWSTAGDADRSSRRVRSMQAMDSFVDNFEKIPVVVLACLVRFREAHHQEGASIFPACQNLLLAARALGIGAVPTTLHPEVIERVFALLGIPAEIEFHCCVPMGYPRGRYGTTERYPTAYTTHWDRWGEPPPWA